MSSSNERRIRDVRDIWHLANNPVADKENAPRAPSNDASTKHKYKTLERHLSMKKTIRKKMMRDLREIGGDSVDDDNNMAATAATTANQTPPPFLDQIKNDQPPPPSIDKPSLWRRLTKGWGHS